MANDAINPWQRFQAGGDALARGTLEFFENGQIVTQKTIYEDSDLSVQQDNPYTLDDWGRVRGDVRYAGLATIIVRNRNGILIRRLDDVASANDGNSGAITKYRDSVAIMISDRSLVVGDIVRTKGYFANTGIGGARYEIVAGGTGTNDNFLFHQLGSGLQAKLLDQEKRRNPLYAGASGNGGTNDTIPVQKVLDQGGDIELPQGYTFAFTTLTISTNVRVYGGGGLRRLGAQSGNAIQITSTDVTSALFVDIQFDSNQNNGNADLNLVGWVLD